MRRRASPAFVLPLVTLLVAPPSAGAPASRAATVILDRPVRVVAYAEPTRPPTWPVHTFTLRISRGADCIEGTTMIREPDPVRFEDAPAKLRRSIGWKDRFLFVREECGGGNMWRRVVEDVFELRDGKLVSLGALGARGSAGIGTCYAAGRFRDVYDDLEINPATSHAGSPGFPIVSQEHDGRLVVDADRTWQANLATFRRNRAVARKQRVPDPTDPRTEDQGKWENVVSPRLANAAIAKYCGRSAALSATLHEAESILPAKVLARFRAALAKVIPRRFPRAAGTTGARRCAPRADAR